MDLKRNHPILNRNYLDCLQIEEDLNRLRQEEIRHSYGGGNAYKGTTSLTTFMRSNPNDQLHWAVQSGIIPTENNQTNNGGET